MACHIERYTALYLYIMLMLRFITVKRAIEHYFDLLEKTLKNNGLLNKPAMLMKLGWLDTACASNVNCK